MKKIPLFLLVCMLGSCTAPGRSTPTVGVPLLTSTETATLVPTFTPTITLTPTLAPPPPETVTYHLLRIEYSSTSDWSTLDLSMAENVLAVKNVEVQGSPTYREAGAGRLALNQPLAESEAGKRVGIVLEYAVMPGALDQTLEVLAKKGDLGGITINIYNMANGQPDLIQSINHTGIVPNSGGVNQRTYKVDLTSLQNTAPITASIQGASRQKMVWAFYYMWYSTSDWYSPPLKDHPLERYDSGSRETIALQIDQAQSAGIDGFISSWWGPGSNTDANLRKLLDIAQTKDFKVSIYFETLAGPNGAPLEEASIRNWLAYFIQNYRDHPAFMRVDGKPVIMLWASATVPVETWERVIASLRDEGLEAVYLSMGYNVTDLDVFDGLHDYGIFTYPNLEALYRTTARAIHYYPLLSDGPTSKIWAATVQPGYDDQLLPGRDGLVQDRLNGDFYRSTWEAAIASNPDWIFITTWNEWWEHTYIEPGELYGDEYLQITKEYADQWKSK